MVVVALESAASVGVASPALAASTQHTITFTPTPSPGPGSPSTPSTKPSAARLPKHAQRFRASRRQEGGATLSCHFRTGGVRSPEPAGGVASSARRVAVNDEGEACLAQLSSSFHVGKKKKKIHRVSLTRAGVFFSVPAAIVSRRWLLVRDQGAADCRASELGRWLQWLPDETASVIKTSHSSPDRPETDRPGQTSERVHQWTKQLGTPFCSINLLFLVKCSTIDSGKRI
jgi:hypothetical protein